MQFGKQLSRALLPLGLLLLLAGCGADREQEAQDLVTSFYQTHQADRPTGALSLNQLITFRHFLSVPLFDLLKDVSVAEEAHQAQLNNDDDLDSPPLVDGDPFTTHPQGASNVRLLTCQVDDNSSDCSVEVIYRDAKTAVAFKSIDRLVLTRETRGWVIDNIVYGGAPNSGMHQGDLQKTLLAILKNNASNTTNATSTANAASVVQ